MRVIMKNKSLQDEFNMTFETADTNDQDEEDRDVPDDEPGTLTRMTT